MGWHFPEETHDVTLGNIEEISLKQRLVPGAFFLLTSALIFLFCRIKP